MPSINIKQPQSGWFMNHVSKRNSKRSALVIIYSPKKVKTNILSFCYDLQLMGIVIFRQLGFDKQFIEICE